MTDVSVSLAERIRVRLRRDPGDEVLIDGKEMRVEWPPSFIRVGPGVFAEIVLDLPTAIQTFPFEAWSGTPEELLKAAWASTLKQVQFAMHEFDAGLERPLFAVRGPAPYVTAFALGPCTIFGPPRWPTPPAALVAVPTPDTVLLHFFRHPRLANKQAIAARMGALARAAFDKSVGANRISPSVYFSREENGFVLEPLAA